MDECIRYLIILALSTAGLFIGIILCLGIASIINIKYKFREEWVAKQKPQRKAYDQCAWG